MSIFEGFPLSFSKVDVILCMAVSSAITTLVYELFFRLGLTKSSKEKVPFRCGFKKFYIIDSEQDNYHHYYAIPAREYLDMANEIRRLRNALVESADKQ